MAATYSYSAFHHVELPGQVRGKRKEILNELFRLLIENGFKKSSFFSSKIWEKNGLAVNVTYHETLNKPWLSGILPGKPFKPSVMICLVWARPLQDDGGLKKICTWLQQINN